MIKSASLTVSVHNGSSRSGGRTYDIYAADTVIRNETVAADLDSIPISPSLYTAPGVNQGQTRTDIITNDALIAHVKSKADPAATGKVQFAFSNSWMIQRAIATLTVKI